MDPDTWGVGNICVLSDFRWVRRREDIVSGCTPGNQQTIIMGASQQPDTWRFCNFGTEVPLKNYLGGELRVYLDGNRIYGPRYVSTDFDLQWEGPIDSPVAGRLLAIAKSIKKRTGKKISVQIHQQYGVELGSARLIGDEVGSFPIELTGSFEEDVIAGMESGP